MHSLIKGVHSLIKGVHSLIKGVRSLIKDMHSLIKDAQSNQGPAQSNQGHAVFNQGCAIFYLGYLVVCSVVEVPSCWKCGLCEDIRYFVTLCIFKYCSLICHACSVLLPGHYLFQGC